MSAGGRGCIGFASLPVAAGALLHRAAGEEPRITVMTENLYVGTPLKDAFEGEALPTRSRK